MVATRPGLSFRHHLGPPGAEASSVVEASVDLLGFHASDPASPFLAAWARVRGFDAGDLERALFDDRTLLKVLAMRRTMFVLPRELAAVVQSACTDTIATGERRRIRRLVEGAGVADDGERWLQSVEARTVEALDRLGEATASELSREVAELRTQIPFAEGKPWAGLVGMSTRVLFLLAAEGRIIRGRPRGGRLSSLYRWVPIERWIPGGLARIPRLEAQAELASRYLATFGPATLDDLRWWAGWTLAETRQALAASRARPIDLPDGGTGWLGRDAEARVPASQAGWVAFLPALDSTTMGWRDRARYLGPHAGDVFDRNGNAGPTIWLDGRIVGGWAQRRDGAIAYRTLEAVGSEVTQLIEARAEELRAWLGALRFVPRFRTPLERRLAADIEA